MNAGRPAHDGEGGTAPVVSVVIPCYNQGRYLPTAVGSVLTQTYPRIEIIVVDDGSTDDTPEAAARFGDKVRYVRRPNGGCPSAKNAGIALATGGYVAMLDADDWWHPDKLSIQMAGFAANPAAGLSHTGFAVVDAHGAATGFVQFRRLGDVHELLERNFIGNLTAVLPRRVIEAVGRFDETLSVVHDWDMWIRVAARYPVLSHAEVLASYRLHGSNISGDPHRVHRQRVRLLRRHATLHPGCGRCRSATRIGRGTARQMYGDELRARLLGVSPARRLTHCARRLMNDPAYCVPAALGRAWRAVWRPVFSWHRRPIQGNTGT